MISSLLALLPGLVFPTFADSLPTTRCSVLVFVTDVVSKSPIPNALVRFPEDADSALTDSAGRCCVLLPRPPGYPVAIEVRHSAYARTAEVALRYWSGGMTYVVGLARKGSLTLRGRVFDARSSKAIAGASVTVSDRSASTDKRGRYVLHGLARGVRFCTARAEGYWPVTDTFRVRPRARGHDFVLRDTSRAAVFGLVATNDGRPVRGAVVREERRGLFAISDSSGNYAMAVSPPGACSLVVDYWASPSRTAHIVQAESTGQCRIDFEVTVTTPRVLADDHFHRVNIRDCFGPLTLGGRPWGGSYFLLQKGDAELEDGLFEALKYVPGVLTR
jgi:hypothetical protein